VRNCTKIKNSI